MSDAPAASEPSSATPVVLGFGLRPEPLLDAAGRIDCFLEPPGPEQLDLLVEALRSGIAAGGALVAVVPDWFDPAGAMRLEMALSVVDGTRVAVHPTALPPLAATALASLISAAGAHAPSAGVLAALIGELEAQLQAITWLGSVGGLSTPAPTLAQHITSFGPGTAFAVTSFPELAVHRLSKAAPEISLPPVERPSRLAVCDHGGDASWMLGSVAGALDVEVREVAPTPAGPKWWGTGKLVEAVLYPTDVQALVRELLAGAETWTCRWCNEVVAGSPCPMCGHRGGPPRGAQQGART